MQVLESIRSALRDLLRQKLRTSLTMLGMIFGVCAVISMLSIGAGAQQEALAAIDALGLRNIIVREKPVESDALYTIRERSLGLTLRDLEELRSVAPEIVAASPRTRVRADQILSASGRSQAPVLGVGVDYFGLLNLEVEQGSLFDPAEQAGYQRVAVLGHRASQQLFAFEDPIGRAIKVGDVWFTVVGTLVPQNLLKEDFEGVAIESADSSIFVPITTALKMFERPKLAGELEELVLQVRQGASVQTNAALVSSVIGQLHGGEDDFALVVPEELLAQSQRTRRIFNIVMGGIAGISLLVGGIGIMNIMLASVVERTREIGVRRALGARQKDIMSQFLLEAVVISLLGGLTGVVLGFTVSWGVAVFSNWNTVVTLFSILLAFGFSVGVGMVFGTYPAMNAARLDPIVALRYE